MSDKRIGIVLASPYPWEIKTERNAQVLSEAGFSVYVLCVGKNESVCRHREATVKSISQKVAKYFYYLTYSFSFSNLYFRYKINQFIKEFDLDAIQFQDLLLAKDCIYCASKHRIPVVWETKENYPYNVYSTIIDAGKNHFPYNYFMGLKRWLKYEAYAMKHADRITYIIEEMRIRMTEDHPNLNVQNKFIELNNGEIVDNFLEIPIKNEIVSRYRDTYNIVYVGSFAKHRGLETAIDAIPGLIKQVPNVKLVIVGKGSNDAELEIASKGLEEHIEFTGWVSFEDVPSYINMADICIVPHKSTRQTDHTMPHKIYHYAILGKMILTSDSTSLKNLVTDNQIGFVFKEGDPMDFAKKVIEIYSLNENEKSNLAFNSTNFSRENDFRITSAHLINYYRSLN